MNKPSVEIIIVKYNQPHYEATTIERVASNTEYPGYSLRVHQAKRGDALSETWNYLIRQSDAALICLLNSDAVVTPGWLTRLVEVLEKFPDVGAVVPSSNQVFLSQIPIPFDHQSIDFDRINRFAAQVALEHTEVRALPTLSAMCVVFPRYLWQEIGGFDEEFFLYGEDTEFFYRLQKQTGKLLAWHTGVYVHHYKARSTQKAVEDGELDMVAVRAKADELCARKMPDLKVSHG